MGDIHDLRAMADSQDGKAARLRAREQVEVGRVAFRRGILDERLPFGERSGGEGKRIPIERGVDVCSTGEHEYMPWSSVSGATIGRPPASTIASA